MPSRLWCSSVGRALGRQFESGHHDTKKKKPALVQRAFQQRSMKLQNDHNTAPDDFDPSDISQADDLMLAAAKLIPGMTLKQAETVGRMASMLDFATKRLARISSAAGKDHDELAGTARGIASAIRQHGMKFGGPRHVRLLEDLADAALGRYVGPVKPATAITRPEDEGMTIEEAMRMLGAVGQQALADRIGVHVRTIGIWRDERGGILPMKWADKVRGMVRPVDAVAMGMVGEVAA